MVRPGAALYGLAPLAGQPQPDAQVVRLEGKILQVRQIDRGMTVGYGATHPSRGRGGSPSVGLGYADGFFRALGNRGLGFSAGSACPWWAVSRWIW